MVFSALRSTSNGSWSELSSRPWATKLVPGWSIVLEVDSSLRLKRGQSHRTIKTSSTPDCDDFVRAIQAPKFGESSVLAEGGQALQYEQVQTQISKFEGRRFSNEKLKRSVYK